MKFKLFSLKAVSSITSVHSWCYFLSDASFIFQIFAHFHFEPMDYYYLFLFAYSRMLPLLIQEGVRGILFSQEVLS